MHLSTRPPLARIMAIDRAIRAGTWPNTRTLADQLEVHRRTIRRDITHLRDRLGAPVEFDSSRHGYYYTEPSYRLPFHQLTEGELVAILVAERVLDQYRDTPFGPDLSRAFAKITAGLTDPVPVDSQQLGEAISFRNTAPAVFDLGIIRDLIAATTRRRRIVMDYYTASRDEETRREVDPYHLASVDGQYYLIGFCHDRREVREFVPARIRSLEETGETFEVPESFRVEEYLGRSFAVLRGDEGESYRVRLRFRGDAIRYVRERLWHPSQTLETTAEGDLIVGLTLGHLREVERWVLSWSPDCLVLAPEELRTRVAEALATAAEDYLHTPNHRAITHDTIDGRTD